MPGARTADPDNTVLTRSSREGKRKRRPRPLLIAVGALLPALLWVSNFTSFGRLGTAYVFVVLNFYIGVVTLVALSLTVMAGLASTDRMFLKIGHRVLFQGAHRVTAIIAVVALGVHIAIKVLGAHAAIGDAIVPFFSQGRSLFIGFGTIAAYLMIVSCWSGMARTRFIGSARPWLWRLVHCSAYASWPIALVHGLAAGRAAATWVIVSYIVCVVLVSLGLLVRVFSKFGRYATGVKPTGRAIGVNVQTAIIPRIQDGPAPSSRLAGATGSPIVVAETQYAAAPARESVPYPGYAAAGPPPTAGYPVPGWESGQPAAYSGYAPAGPSAPGYGVPDWQAGPPYAPPAPSMPSYPVAGPPAPGYPAQGWQAGPYAPAGPPAPNYSPAAEQWDGWGVEPEDEYTDDEQSWAPTDNGRPRLRLVTDDDEPRASPGARGRHSAGSGDEAGNAPGGHRRSRASADEPGDRRSQTDRYAPTSDGWAPPTPKPEFRSRQRRRG